MFIHCLYTFIIQSITQLVEFLTPPRNAQGSEIICLAIEMIIENDLLAISPNLEETIHNTNEIMDILLSYFLQYTNGMNLLLHSLRSFVIRNNSENSHAS